MYAFNQHNKAVTDVNVILQLEEAANIRSHNTDTLAAMAAIDADIEKNENLYFAGLITLNEAINNIKRGV